MNLLFYQATLKRGGAERVISTLANYYVQEGHTVNIAVIDKEPPEYCLNEKVNYINIYQLKDNDNAFSAIFYNFKLLFDLNQILKQIKPDLVVCFGQSQLLHALLLKRLRRFKVIGAERTNPFSAPDKKLRMMIKKRLCLFSDGYIFQSDGARSFYKQKKLKNDIIIGNPIGAEFLQDCEKTFSERKHNTFCTIGRLVPAKGYEFLINSFIEFRIKHPEARLVIYGDGPERKNLENIIIKFKAENYIILFGKIEDVPNTLSQHQYFILSSIREGLPNTLIEAMAMGCVCIATDCDFGPREIITNYNNGILVPVGDKKQLLEAMENVYCNAELCKEISFKAQQIRYKYAVEIIAQKYMDYFITILNQK